MEFLRGYYYISLWGGPGGGGVGSFQIVVSWKETFKELKHAPSALLSYIDLYKHAGFFEEHERSANAA